MIVIHPPVSLRLALMLRAEGLPSSAAVDSARRLLDELRIRGIEVVVADWVGLEWSPVPEAESSAAIAAWAARDASDAGTQVAAAFTESLRKAGLKAVLPGWKSHDALPPAGSVGWSPRAYRMSDQERAALEQIIRSVASVTEDEPQIAVYRFRRELERFVEQLTTSDAHVSFKDRVEAIVPFVGTDAAARLRRSYSSASRVIHGGPVHPSYVDGLRQDVIEVMTLVSRRMS